MNVPPANSPVIRIKFGPPGPRPEKIEVPKPPAKWPLRQWLLFIALIFVAHVAAIFIFGEYKPAPVRAVKNVPQLQVADSSSELVALENPALFALPRPQNSKFFDVPNVKPVAFRWSEKPRLLPLASENLGATFTHFMQTNVFGNFKVDFKPPLNLSAPAAAIRPLFPENSTLQIEGDLVQRPLANKINLPDLPFADVIAPSKVQVLVDADGNVVSAILLPLNNVSRADHYDAADQRALDIARTLQFAPAPSLTVGKIIFNWRTVPPPATNPPAATP